jgi:hypothetical protein
LFQLLATDRIGGWGEDTKKLAARKQNKTGGQPGGGGQGPLKTA